MAAKTIKDVFRVLMDMANISDMGSAKKWDALYDELEGSEVFAQTGKSLEEAATNPKRIAEEIADEYGQVNTLKQVQEAGEEVSGSDMDSMLDAIGEEVGTGGEGRELTGVELDEAIAAVNARAAQEAGKKADALAGRTDVPETSNNLSTLQLALRDPSLLPPAQREQWESDEFTGNFLGTPSSNVNRPYSILGDAGVAGETSLATKSADQEIFVNVEDVAEGTDYSVVDGAMNRAINRALEKAVREDKWPTNKEGKPMGRDQAAKLFADHFREKGGFGQKPGNTVSIPKAEAEGIMPGGLVTQVRVDYDQNFFKLAEEARFPFLDELDAEGNFDPTKLEQWINGEIPRPGYPEPLTGRGIEKARAKYEEIKEDAETRVTEEVSTGVAKGGWQTKAGGEGSLTKEAKEKIAELKIKLAEAEGGDEAKKIEAQIARIKKSKGSYSDTGSRREIPVEATPKEMTQEQAREKLDKLIQQIAALKEKQAEDPTNNAQLSAVLSAKRAEKTFLENRIDDIGFLPENPDRGQPFFQPSLRVEPEVEDMGTPNQRSEALRAEMGQGKEFATPDQIQERLDFLEGQKRAGLGGSQLKSVEAEAEYLREALKEGHEIFVSWDPSEGKAPGARKEVSDAAAPEATTAPGELKQFEVRLTDSQIAENKKDAAKQRSIDRENEERRKREAPGVKLDTEFKKRQVDPEAQKLIGQNPGYYSDEMASAYQEFEKVLLDQVRRNREAELVEDFATRNSGATQQRESFVEIPDEATQFRFTGPGMSVDQQPLAKTDDGGFDRAQGPTHTFNIPGMERNVTVRPPEGPGRMGPGGPVNPQPMPPQRIAEMTEQGKLGPLRGIKDLRPGEFEEALASSEEVQRAYTKFEGVRQTAKLPTRQQLIHTYPEGTPIRGRAAFTPGDDEQELAAEATQAGIDVVATDPDEAMLEASDELDLLIPDMLSPTEQLVAAMNPKGKGEVANPNVVTEVSENIKEDAEEARTMAGIPDLFANRLGTTDHLNPEMMSVQVPRGAPRGRATDESNLPTGTDVVDVHGPLEGQPTGKSPSGRELGSRVAEIRGVAPTSDNVPPEKFGQFYDPATDRGAELHNIAKGRPASAQEFITEGPGAAEAKAGIEAARAKGVEINPEATARLIDLTLRARRGERGALPRLKALLEKYPQVLAMSLIPIAMAASMGEDDSIPVVGMSGVPAL